MAGSEPREQLPGADIGRPSAARMYDYYLGGSHNFAPDRELAEQMLTVFPDVRRMAHANRAFLNRAVRYLLDRGVRQFLDLGSGIPTAGNVHEVCRAIAPESRVVYVDVDPVAVVHSETILAGDPRAGVLQADLRQVETVLSAPVTRRLIDFTQPVGVLAVAVLHFLTNADDPAGVLAAYRDAVPSGSHLALTHGTPEVRPDAAARATALYRNSANTAHPRTRAEIAALFAGWELVEPGLTWVPAWRPDWPDEVGDDPSWSQVLAAVAVKP